MIGMTLRSYEHPKHGPILIALATVNGTRISYEEPVANAKDEDIVRAFLMRAQSTFAQLDSGDST